MPNRRIGTFLRPSVIAPILCLIYALWVVVQFNDPLALVTLGSEFAPTELQDNIYTDEGYDGQFVYYFARYGINAEPYVDRPAYRGQRILLSVFGWIAALGQTSLLPYGLLAVNLLALGIGTYWLEQLLMQGRSVLRTDQKTSKSSNLPLTDSPSPLVGEGVRGRGGSMWFAVGYAFSAGVFGAARLTTTEPLAYGLALGGILFFERDRWRLSAILFALAILSKETAIFFPAVFGLRLLLNQRVVRAVTFGAIVLMPFVLWQVILLITFGNVGIGSGGGGATGFEIIPFMGAIKIVQAALTTGEFAALVAFLLLNGLFVILPTLWAIWQCLADARYTWQVRNSDKPPSTIRGWDSMTWVLLATVAIMPFVPFSTYSEPLGILRFIVGLQIGVILYAAAKRKHRALMYSTLWFATSFIVILSDVALASG